MENSFESYRKEFEPWLGTLVMFPLWGYRTVRLVDVVQEDFQGSSEWYYVVEDAVSYTHLRAHETPEHLVCRLLLEKKKQRLINLY